MKKATKNTETSAIKLMTLDQIRGRKLTKAEREHSKRFAAMPDNQIDLTDIPEVTGRTKRQSNPNDRPAIFAIL